MGQGRFTEAEPLVLKVCNQVTSRKDVLPSELSAATGRVERLYDSWDTAEPGKGCAEKAAEWRAKLEEMSKSPNVQKSKTEEGTERNPNTEQETSKSQNVNTSKDAGEAKP